MVAAPKVAAVQDLSGFGRCSLTVVLPVLAAMGCQCCPVLTAYLSAHTAYPRSECAVFHDMSGQMAGTLRHWSELETHFQAIYSGFLGSARQIDILRDFLDRFAGGETLVLVDPVMGDRGVPYRTYTPEMCRQLGALAARADVVTPNLTEAALLLGVDYDPRPEEGKLRRWLEALSLGGRRSVAITGVHLEDGRVGAICLDRADGQVSLAATREEPAHFPGTGDLYAGVLLGALLRGEGLAQANQRAVRFVQHCARRTLELGTPALEGVQFEGLLSELL